MPNEGKFGDPDCEFSLSQASFVLGCVSRCGPGAGDRGAVEQHPCSGISHLHPSHCALASPNAVPSFSNKFPYHATFYILYICSRW